MMMIHFQQGYMIFMFFIIFFIINGSPTMAARPRRQMVIHNPLVELSTTVELERLAGYGQEKLSTVVVSGTLLCDAAYNLERINSPLDSHPIPGASVGFSCHSRTSRRSTSKRKRSSKSSSSSNWVIKGKTDQYGDFMIELPSHLHAIPNMEKRCFVRILGLPKKSPCHRSTLIHNNHKGIKLSSSSRNGVRTYSTHGFHLAAHNKQHSHPFMRCRKTIDMCNY